jgi:hypothetical protein
VKFVPSFRTPLIIFTHFGRTISNQFCQNSMSETRPLRCNRDAEAIDVIWKRIGWRFGWENRLKISCLALLKPSKFIFSAFFSTDFSFEVFRQRANFSSEVISF